MLLLNKLFLQRLSAQPITVKEASFEYKPIKTC